MKLCKAFLKPGLPAVRCMVRFPVPPPAYPAPRPAGQAALRAAFGGGLRPPPTPRPSAGAALRARLPLHPPPGGFTACPAQACPPAPSAGAQPAALRAARRPAAAAAAPPPGLRPTHKPPPCTRPPPTHPRRGPFPAGTALTGCARPGGSAAAPAGAPLPAPPPFPLKSPQSLANAAKIRIIKWYISYRKGEQKLWQIKRKW